MKYLYENVIVCDIDSVLLDVTKLYKILEELPEDERLEYLNENEELKKQLKHKEQECEELKKDCPKRCKSDNYKQAIDEIEKIVIKANSISSLDSDEIRQIQNIINKVKENNNELLDTYYSLYIS